MAIGARRGMIWIGFVGVLISGVLALAWIEGGGELVRVISVPVAVPVPGAAQ